MNGSAWVVSNLDLEFELMLPDGGANPEQYCKRFTRRFTNVPPGGSICVQSNTPKLMLTFLKVSHQPYEPPAMFTAGFMGVANISCFDSFVVATPGQNAGVNFTGWNKFEEIRGH